MLLKALSIEPKTRIMAQKSITSATAATTPPCVRASALFGEIDDVVDDFGVLREEGVEVVDQPVGQSEALDHGENHRYDRHQRHQRIEREAALRTIVPCSNRPRAV
ncbi:MAG: hypothetical protein ACLTG8_05385 [Alistipes finegoldii]|uniref:hypothetical protein n=1 Tax=Alistipes finegoldii TaxID=214856 RepID=UPI0039922ADE